jgi:type IV pilus assembly protein PilQ
MTAASSHVNHRRPEAGRLSRPFRATALVALAGALAFAAQAALAQAATRLTKVELQPQPGNQLEVKLVLDGPAPQPIAFTIDNPARLAVDLPGTSVALDSRRIDVKSGGVDTIVAAEASGRTRVVFNLDSLQPYSTRTEGNNVFVSLGRSAGGNAAATVSTATASAPAAGMESTGGFSIDKVDFRRGTDGAGRIMVRTNDPRVQASLKQEGGRLIVDFPGTSVAPEAARRYDVVDFATPVSSFDVTSTPAGARIIVAATGDFEQLGYQSDRDYVLELRQRAKSAAAADPGKKEYRGERLTLNFQDIETRAVLQLLAETSGQNIVVSDTVQGNVTLRLQNVPWDQALDIVMRTKGLDKRQEGNVIYVAPAEELAAREKQMLESQKSLTELAPVRTEYLQVNYAKASDLASLIKSQGKGSLLSERGSLAIDERTNTLLLQDTADRLADIRRLVQTLDIPVKQVLIEARIVIVNDDFSRELGVRFGGALVGNYGSSDGLMYVGKTGLDTDPGNSGPIINPTSPGGAGLTGSQVTTPSVNDRYMVNLPISNPASRIAMTLLDTDYVVDLEITAAQREGRGEVVSAPRVITANGKEAIIEQGTEIPYQESASSGATTTQFKKAVLALKVTPQITPDDRVILDLTVSKDSVGQTLPSATGGNVPSIDTREITTQVLVNDGQTVVLGGILETERRDTVNKVPFLGDVPGLGFLFRSKGKTDNKDELLIFVTPKILREGAEIY